MLGLGRTGSSGSNGSGDYAIAFSTAPEARVPMTPPGRTLSPPVLQNDAVSPLFQAAIEATEEAVYNSLFTAKTTTGNGHTVAALPVEQVLEICRRNNALRQANR